MIDPEKIKAYTGIKNNDKAQKLAEEINEYSRRNNLDELQIIALLEKYRQTNLAELAKRQTELKGQTDLLKSDLGRKILGK
jgi:predicted house-cleaning noncanonical NTP pyrophosphatase (MazG superfamily)